jgi:hypothetical protein
LVRDGAGVVRGLLEFLGVDPARAQLPPTANESRRVRSARLQRMIFMPRLLMPMAPVLRRFPFVRALRTRLLAMNSEPRPRAPMDPRLRRQLLDEVAPEIERLGRLIGRDLSPWLERGAPEPSPARETALKSA